MTGPKILTLDIESAPNVAHVWGLWQNNVSLSQLRESSHMMCWAAKWYGSKKVEFKSEFHHDRADMVSHIHNLVDAADIAIHYNGKRYDMPHLNREFILAGLNPPSPVQHVDLLNVVKQTFKFPSNKLEYVSRALGLSGKAATGGHELWVKCLAGNSYAWSQMRKYNKQDVVLTEQLYDKLLPWIKGHPHLGLIDGREFSCPNCGVDDAQKRGEQRTATSKFQRYQCNLCGAWFRTNKATERVTTRGIG